MGQRQKCRRGPILTLAVLVVAQRARQDSSEGGWGKSWRGGSGGSAESGRGAGEGRQEETSPTSVHARNLRRGEEARNGNKKQSWRGSDGNGWERAGEGLCGAAVVGKGHGAARSSGRLCRGTPLDFQVAKKSFCVYDHSAVGLCVSRRPAIALEMETVWCELVLRGREGVISVHGVLGSHRMASAGTAPW